MEALFALEKSRKGREEVCLGFLFIEEFKYFKRYFLSIKRGL